MRRHDAKEGDEIKQVYLTKYGIWSDVIEECETFILATDADGVNVYVIKDGFQMVRNAE